MSSPAATTDSLKNRVNQFLLTVFVALTVTTVVLGYISFKRWKNGRIATEILTRATQGEIGAAEQALASLDTEWVDGAYALQCQVAVWSVTEPVRALEAIEPGFARQSRAFQILAAELAIRTGKYDRAASIIKLLAGSPAVESQVLFLQSWLAIIQKDIPSALSGLKELLSREPTHRGAAFLRARLLLESPNFSDVARGRTDLRMLSAGRDFLGLEALVARALQPKATGGLEEKSEVFQAILDHPLARHAYFLKETDSLSALLAASEGVSPSTILPLAERLLEIAPANPRALSSMVFFLQETLKPSAADPLLAQLAKLEPESGTTLQLQCRQLILMQKPEAALALLEKADHVITATPRMAGLIGTLVDATQNAGTDIQRRVLELGLALPPDNYLAWLNLRRRALDVLPERRDAIINQVRETATGERALPGAEWLLLAGQFEHAITLAATAPGPESERARLITFEGRIGLKRFEEAASSLADLPAVTAQGALLRARLALAQGDRTEASSKWRTGFDRAQRDDDPVAKLQLATGAGRIGLHTEASQAFAQVSQAIVSNKIACDAQTASIWLAVELRLGSSRSALAAARVLGTKTAARTPAQLESRFWESYLELLLNEDLLGSKDTARSLNEAAPADVRFKALYTLAQLKTGQGASALSTLEHELAAGAGDNLPLQVRVVAAAVCEANGRQDTALAWKKTLENQTLLPEEKSLVAIEILTPFASTQ